MYISTRKNSAKVSAGEAIIQGMVPEGGLYLPERLPEIKRQELKSMSNLSYTELAEKIFSIYLDDFSAEDIRECVEGAYGSNKFDNKEIAPVIKLEEGLYILELWHGPTAAFKDMALQVLPYFLTTALRNQGVRDKVVILVATSGDTGKAALEGFRNVDGTEVVVFYPHQGVSEVQELQMRTTDGNNTHVYAVEGNFDDCQSKVKELFGDHAYNEFLQTKGARLSSANSINWGRLLPQIVYYFSAYFQLIRRQQIELGEYVDFVVPTGNFGNILAGYIAKRMGLPVRKLVCASNANDVLTDFFQSGIYDANRAFKKTCSPSMDILVSSNLERFLYYMADEDGAKIASWMEDLKNTGRFSVDPQTKARMDEVILAGKADDVQTKEKIAEVYENSHYLLDTHTAVALHVSEELGREVVTIVDATAHPYKFVGSVYGALYPNEILAEDVLELEMIDKLVKQTLTSNHPALASLANKGVRPLKVIDPENMAEEVSKVAFSAEEE